MPKDNKAPITLKRNPKLLNKQGKNNQSQNKNNKSAERTPKKYLKQPFKNSPTPVAKKGNGIVVDTSVLIHNPESINVLLDHGNNDLYIPLQVLMELDNLKNRPHVGIEAREAIRIIDEIQTREAKTNSRHHLHLLVDTTWGELESLSREKPDNVVLAAANYVLVNKQVDYKVIKFLSCDRALRILAKRYMSSRGLIIEDYLQDQTVELDDSGLPQINVPAKIIEKDPKHKNVFFFTLEKLSKRDKTAVENLPENGGVICFSDWDGNVKANPGENSPFKANFVAMRKGESFVIIDKEISAYGIKQYSMNGSGPNWEQMVAFAQLLNPNIKVVFVEGGAGGGKTLLAMATALEQKDDFRHILVTRPLIHLQGEDNMGFLPGGVDKKMAPWLKPIWEAVDELKDKAPTNYNKDGSDQIDISPLKKKYAKDEPPPRNRSKGRIKEEPVFKEKTEEQKIKDCISVESLDYIRGRSIRNAFLVIDEGQNLTPHEIKTIITRVAQGTKLVITGDLSQIDRKNLDRHSSGLAYAIERLLSRDNLKNSKVAAYVNMFAAIRLKQSVRSDVAFYASEVMF
jgi:PhoH-like ATPase